MAVDGHPPAAGGAYDLSLLEGFVHVFSGLLSTLFIPHRGEQKTNTHTEPDS